MKSAKNQNSASALVVILAFLALITVLVVGMLDTIRKERISAASHLRGMQADYLAQSGVERVIGALQQQTAPQASGGKVYNWITQPGQLSVANAASGGVPTGLVPLHSGVAVIPGSQDSVYLPPNLNTGSFRSPGVYQITDVRDDSGAVPKMQVAWIYVRKDTSKAPFDSGSAVPDTTSEDAKANPIVGRFAYWADDESCKMNVNLAWERCNDNTDPVWHPSKIDLTALRPVSSYDQRAAFPSEVAKAIHDFTKTQGFLNCQEDAWRVSGTAAKAVGAYKFETTHYNTDPDTTIFGAPKILLTTQINNVPKDANGNPTRNFINILKNDTENPGGDLIGAGSAIDTVKLSATLKMLNQHLARTDWPMASGKSFQDKYFSGNSARLTQLSVNIIDYVRSKESSNRIIAPLRGYWKDADHFELAAVSGVPAFLGVSRSPCITELGVWVSGTSVSISGTTYYPCKLKMEIFLPSRYGLEQVDINNDLRFYTDVKVSVPATPASPSLIKTDSLPDVIRNDSNPTQPNILKAGQYAVVTKGFNLPSASGARPSTVTVSAALARPASSGQNSTGDRLNIVPLVGSATRLSINIDNKNVAEDDISSVEVDDPRVNKCLSDWVAVPKNSFCKPNSDILTIGKTANTSMATPQADTDSSGNITDASLYMPPPKGATYGGETNDGTVVSVGELGYISTSEMGYINATTPIPSVPWRTLRLQPNNYQVNGVPDWALMDLFTIPMTVSSDIQAVFQANGTSYGGRININSEIKPFNLKRILPLAGILKNCTADSAGSTIDSKKGLEIAQNIYSRTVADGSVKGKLYGFASGYFCPGEICEIKGVADSGETSEELVRQISNQITTRGNVFTVYTIGQTLQQTPLGQLKVTGERRLKTMVERYVYDSATGEVRFRSISTKSLTP